MTGQKTVYPRRPGPSALAPVHPGELLREDVLPAIGKTRQEIADLLGISRQALSNILSERAGVSTDMAQKLGKLCGNGPTLWINLQAEWDLAHPSPELRAQLERIPTLEAMA